MGEPARSDCLMIKLLHYVPQYTRISLPRGVRLFASTQTQDLSLSIMISKVRDVHNARGVSNTDSGKPAQWILIAPLSQ